MGTVERRNREKEKRRTDIIAAAKKIFFARGFNDTTMDEIAADAELSKGTLYLYFKNREELVYTIMYESMEIIKNMIEEALEKGGPAIEKLKNIAKMIPEYYSRYSDFFEFTGNFDYRVSSMSMADTTAFQCSQLIDEIIEVFISILKEGIKDGSIRSDIELEKTAILYANMVTSLLQRVSTMGKIFNQRGNYKPQDLIEHMLNIMIKALQ